MNQQTLLRQRNSVANLIRTMNRHKNCLKWSSNETDDHIKMKLEICKYLKQNNIEFYTEAIFHSGLRADIVDADRLYCIEIVNTESEESIMRKRKDYPLPIIVVNANQEFNEKLVT